MFRPRFAIRCLVACVLAFSVGVAARAADKTAAASKASSAAPTASSQAGAILPEAFAGWQIAGTPVESASPQLADDGDAAVLTEYGFSRFESASYRREQDTLAVKAIQFGDATGAFGAFTFYRRPGMVPEKIGHDAVFDGTRVLFWSGTVLVDAKFSRITPMSAAELRDLASQLPPPVGNQGTLPTLPDYLPKSHLEPTTLQYAIGPQAYRLSGGVLPPSLVDFGRSAEVVTAQYNALSGTGTLTIIDYPTPDIAIDREHAVRAYFASHGVLPGQAQNAWTPALADSNPAAILCRRSGPLLIVTSGGFSAGSANQVLQQVHYEVNLTASSSKHYVPDTVQVAQLILGIAVLVGIFALIAIVAAVSLGGGRVAWRRFRSKTGAPETDPAEFIRLNLKD